MTIVRRLAESAARDGARVAIEHDGRRLTFAGLDAAANAGARRLLERGVTLGDRVLIAAHPSLEFVVAWLAALKLRAIVLPVNPAYGAHELDFILADAAPRAIVASPDARFDRPIVPIDAFDPRASASLEAEAPVADDPALLVYTSGTTGRPKGALHAHRSLLANAEAVIGRWRMTCDDRLLHALPLFHVHGLCVALHTALLARAEILLLTKFEAGVVLDAFARRGVTVFMGVPTMYARLAAVASAPSAPALRLLVSGSAPLESSVAERVRAAFGRAPIERYGMTETLITLARAPEPGAGVGRPVDGVETKLGADGELFVRGASLFAGYWNAPEFTRAAFVDGWFATGDVATQDASGEFTIVGRKKDFVNSGGLKIAPIEVEEALLSHPLVAEACVVGVPDQDLGEAVAAAVVAKDGAALDSIALVEHCRARIAAFKRPRHVVVVAALPRNAMGKVTKSEVRALFVRG